MQRKNAGAGFGVRADRAIGPAAGDRHSRSPRPTWGLESPSSCYGPPGSAPRLAALPLTPSDAVLVASAKLASDPAIRAAPGVVIAEIELVGGALQVVV